MEAKMTRFLIKVAVGSVLVTVASLAFIILIVGLSQHI